ncbi:MAG: hypothetical protein PHF97_10855 [Bacteroidales bacterium]|nr:chloride channel protein [Bacteroidales bacterium]MDD4604290.1 hypothetical protein [Bacteroidales bacterium]
MKKTNEIKEVFKIFQNKESFFSEINIKQSNRLILNQILIISLFAFLYGAVMGSSHSLIQSIVAGIKIIVLFLSTVIICFPSFFIIQQVLGSKMSVRQMMIIVLSGLVLTSTIAISFTPIVIVFQITGGNYHFLQLLHVAIFIFAGIFGMRLMVDALKYACENKDIYPKIGVNVFRIWIIIFAFVGIQLAWNLRPFLCEKNEEFKIFRKYEGNFYTAIVYSVEQLVSPTGNPEKEKINKAYSNTDSANQQRKDTTEILKLLKK